MNLSTLVAMVVAATAGMKERYHAAKAIGKARRLHTHNGTTGYGRVGKVDTLRCHPGHQNLKRLGMLPTRT